MKKCFIWSIVAVFLVSMLFIGVSCKKATTTETTAATETSAETTAATSTAAAETTAAPAAEKVIGFSFASYESLFYIAQRDYFKKAIDQKGGIQIIFNSAGGDVTKQLSNIEDYISRKVDIIMAVPQDSKAIGAAITKAHAAGIKFVTYNRAASPDLAEQPDAHIGVDTTQQAYVAGIGIADYLDKAGVKGKALSIIGDLRDENAVNRKAGFEKAAKERGVEIVAEVPSEWNPDKALTGTKDALLAHPEINTILLASDFLLPAVQSALEGAGKWKKFNEDGHIWLTSQDIYPVGYKTLIDGHMDVNIPYDMWPMSVTGADVIAKLLNGEKLDKTVYLTESRMVNRDNIATTENLWGKDYYAYTQ